MNKNNYPSNSDMRNQDELALRAMARPDQRPDKCRCGAPVDDYALREFGIVRFVCGCDCAEDG